MKPRYYQQDAVDSVWEYLNERRGNPCIVIPTAGGKSFVMGSIANTVVSEFGGRVMILAHVKELLQQNRKACLQANPSLSNRIGTYSAGLKSREYKDDIVVAGIQSAYKDATKFGKRDLILVDEVHLIPTKSEGMYIRFLKEAQKVNPNLRVVGLTATPYRMRGGMICGPDNMINEICYEVSVKELIDKGYLSNLITKATADPVDFSGVRTVAGDFDKRQVAEIVEADEVVLKSVEEIVQYTTKRSSVIVFCHSIAHSKQVAMLLEKATGERVAEVYGDTHADERSQTLAAFRSGGIKYLCNVGVLTTGFDAPNIDCVVLLMPTKSPGKYYQCVGRGFRICEGKTDCLVLDYGGNIMRHGPVDCMEIKEKQNGKGEAPAKTCPECNTVCHLSIYKCPDCGYVWPVEEKDPHEAKASAMAIISGEVNDQVVRVTKTELFVHQKKGWKAGDPRTVRVEYSMQAGWKQKEWLCPEHKGYAREKFLRWWEQACVDKEVKAPTNADYVVEAFNIGILREPGEITIRNIIGNKFSEVFDRNFEIEPLFTKLHKYTVPSQSKVEEDPFDDFGSVPF